MKFFISITFLNLVFKLYLACKSKSGTNNGVYTRASSTGTTKPLEPVSSKINLFNNAS